jgi:hypothetical protein
MLHEWLGDHSKRSICFIHKVIKIKDTCNSVEEIGPSLIMVLVACRRGQAP